MKKVISKPTTTKEDIIKEFEEEFKDKFWDTILFTVLFGNQPQTEITARNFVKSFLRQILEEYDHDHEILINSILETKNKELKQSRQEILEEIDKEKKRLWKKGTEFGDNEEIIGYRDGLQKAIEIIKRI